MIFAAARKREGKKTALTTESGGLKNLGLGLLLILLGYLNFFALALPFIKGRYSVAALFILSFLIIGVGIWAALRGWRRSTWSWRFYRLLLVAVGLYGMIFAAYIVFANFAYVKL